MISFTYKALTRKTIRQRRSKLPSFREKTQLIGSERNRSRRGSETEVVRDEYNRERYLAPFGHIVGVRSLRGPP